jgi:hypothetical protein
MLWVYRSGGGGREERDAHPAFGIYWCHTPCSRNLVTQHRSFPYTSLMYTLLLKVVRYVPNLHKWCWLDNCIRNPSEMFIAAVAGSCWFLERGAVDFLFYYRGKFLAAMNISDLYSSERHHNYANKMYTMCQQDFFSEPTWIMGKMRNNSIGQSNTNENVFISFKTYERRKKTWHMNNIY